MHEGKPVLDLGLLLDVKDGRISMRKLRSLQKDRVGFRSFWLSKSPLKAEFPTPNLLRGSR